jgi:ubiquinone biosynthesis protein UbiJ
MSSNPEGHDRSPNPLLALAGRALEAAFARMLELDPESRTRIAALDGRAVTVVLRGTPLAMRIAVDGERLAVGPAFEADSNLSVRATPGAFLAMLFARGGDLPPGKVEIAGDAELARRLERIASAFAPDFDEAFARVFGDVAGFQIARALRRALAWGRESAHSFARDSAEFLTEEGRDVVGGPEIEEFLDDVDALRERGDRLEARVRRLLREAGMEAGGTARDPGSRP